MKKEDISPIIIKGYVQGTNSEWWKRRFCLDAKTGEMKCRTREISRGCLTFADGMLYCLDNRGRISLIASSQEELKLVSRFAVPRVGRSLSFAHPVICGGRLYIRHADHLYAYDIKAK